MSLVTKFENQNPKLEKLLQAMEGFKKLIQAGDNPDFIWEIESRENEDNWGGLCKFFYELVKNLNHDNPSHVQIWENAYALMATDSSRYNIHEVLLDSGRSTKSNSLLEKAVKRAYQEYIAKIKITSEASLKIIHAAELTEIWNEDTSFEQFIIDECIKFMDGLSAENINLAFETAINWHERSSQYPKNAEISLTKVEEYFKKFANEDRHEALEAAYVAMGAGDESMQRYLKRMKCVLANQLVILSDIALEQNDFHASYTALSHAAEYDFSIVRQKMLTLAQTATDKELYATARYVSKLVIRIKDEDWISKSAKNLYAFSDQKLKETVGDIFFDTVAPDSLKNGHFRLEQN